MGDAAFTLGLLVLALVFWLQGSRAIRLIAAGIGLPNINSALTLSKLRGRAARAELRAPDTDGAPPAQPRLLTYAW
jgi:hypothetical protein